MYRGTGGEGGEGGTQEQVAGEADRG